MITTPEVALGGFLVGFTLQGSIMRPGCDVGLGGRPVLHNLIVHGARS